MRPLGWIAAAALGLAGSLAHAQAWPDKPVRWVMPFAASGSFANVLARAMAPHLSERLGQPLVIENRPGASGNVGAESVARSAPDGQVFLIATTAVVINDSLYTLKFNPLADLAPVVQLSSMQYVLVAREGLPAGTLDEVLRHARSPGVTLSCGYTGGAAQVGCELLRAVGRIPLTGVPYKGAGPALQDLLGGRIDLVFEILPTIAPHARARKVRALAVADPSMGAGELAPLPTLASRMPGFAVTSWVGLMAPAGTPTAVIERMNREVNAVLALPELRNHPVTQGIELRSGSVAEFAALVRREHAYYAGVARAHGLRGGD